MGPLPTLLSSEVAADPESFYRRLRDSAPVHFDESIESYLVARYDDIAACYRNPLLTTRCYEWQFEPVFGPTLVQMDGKQHARRRSMIMKYLRGPGLEKWAPAIRYHTERLLGPIVEDATNRLTKEWVAGAEIDLSASFSMYLPTYVILDILGLPEHDQDLLYGWHRSIMAYLGNLSQDPEVAERGEQTRIESRAFLHDLVTDRRRSPRDDMISALCEAQIDGDRMTDEDIVSFLSLLMVAGAETTDKTIIALFGHLLADRRQFELVRDDRSWLPAAIAETLRYTPPTQMSARIAEGDTRIGDTEIPSGSMIMMLMASGNRDERRFRDPDVFDVTREDLLPDRAFKSSATHLAFGGGRHFCAGASVAELELTMAVSTLLDTFPDMRLVPGFVPEYAGIKHRAPTSLRVLVGG